ncbi:MAG: NADH-quinone oxidoreductase subunit F, partial [Clostridia bacterium]|nr:NADH-quinone oxidoreductase subunit F [Clostridia bacterium]
MPVYDAFKAAAAGNPKCKVGQVGCIGMCQYEPIVEVIEGGKRTTYVKMDAEKAARVYQEHILGGQVVTDYLLVENGITCNSLEDTTFYKLQKRIALRNCGIIDPENIDEYIARDGYAALYKVITEMSSEDVVNVILDSGLRGRGGAGFPTGKKWSFAAVQQAPQKFVCCNADEGDPGAFMDRSVLEGDPHALLEAMTIAGKAIGATQGYIYVRAEYPVAVKRLNIAIKQAKEYGLLGDNILGTDFC